MVLASVHARALVGSSALAGVKERAGGATAAGDTLVGALRRQQVIQRGTGARALAGTFRVLHTDRALLSCGGEEMKE